MTYSLINQRLRLDFKPISRFALNLIHGSKKLQESFGRSLTHS